MMHLARSVMAAKGQAKVLLGVPNGCHMGMHFRDDAEPGQGVMGPKDHANGDNQKLCKHKCEYNGNCGVYRRCQKVELMSLTCCKILSHGYWMCRFQIWQQARTIA